MRQDAGNITKGQFVSENNQVQQVLKTEHNFRGRGSATVRIKYKNLTSNTTIEKTYRSNEALELLDIEAVLMQYLYCDDKFLYFMNPRTYEQTNVKKILVGNIARYLKEGESLYVLIHNSKPISIRIPAVVRLAVTQAQDAAKGDTATSAKKDVKVETGVIVKVPLFIKKGDIIAVNPETGNYIERVSQ